jgi:hypothetical protein
MVVWVEALDGGDPEKDADENGYVCVCVCVCVVRV